MTTTKILHLSRQVAAAAARRYEIFCTPIEGIDVADGAFDHVFTDPPYSKRVQDNIRRGRESRSNISAPVHLDFDPADRERRDRWAKVIARAARRWAGVFSDHEGSMEWAYALERAGMEYVRCVPWIKTGDVELTSQPPKKSGAPQFTGDRPGNAREELVLAHRRGVRMRWNGGGQQRVYTHAVVPPSQRIHPNQKPIGLLDAILRDFCDRGETVGDFFCGAGTTLVAASHLGIGAVGSDLTKRWADFSRRRVLGALPAGSEGQHHG